MADIQGTLAGELPDPTESDANTATGQGSLGSELPQPDGGFPDAVPAGPTQPESRNPTVETATGPAVAMEVDLATVKKVIQGYTEEIDKLHLASHDIRRIEQIQNPGEDESSYTYVAEHSGTARSLGQAWQSLIDTLTARRDNLEAVVRQYEGTEGTNASDFRERE